MPYTFVPEKVVDPKLVYSRHIAFCKALAESPEETQEVIGLMIEILAKRIRVGSRYMVEMDTARRQASEAVAQVVFKEIYDKLFIERLEEFQNDHN